MLKIALLVLTLTEDGATRVTLSTTEDADDCIGLQTMVASVLEDSETVTLASMCGPTNIELTPFEHGSGPEDEIHRYRVVVKGEGDYLVTPLPQDASCEADEKASPAVYCARSSQSVLAN